MRRFIKVTDIDGNSHLIHPQGLRHVESNENPNRGGDYHIKIWYTGSAECIGLYFSNKEELETLVDKIYTYPNKQFEESI